MAPGETMPRPADAVPVPTLEKLELPGVFAGDSAPLPALTGGFRQGDAHVWVPLVVRVDIDRLFRGLREHSLVRDVTTKGNHGMVYKDMPWTHMSPYRISFVTLVAQLWWSVVSTSSMGRHQPKRTCHPLLRSCCCLSRLSNCSAEARRQPLPHRHNRHVEEGAERGEIHQRGQIVRRGHASQAGGGSRGCCFLPSRGGLRGIRIP